VGTLVDVMHELLCIRDRQLWFSSVDFDVCDADDFIDCIERSLCLCSFWFYSVFIYHFVLRHDFIINEREKVVGYIQVGCQEQRGKSRDYILTSCRIDWLSL
jgi:hypothetical protein